MSDEELTPVPEEMFHPKQDGAQGAIKGSVRPWFGDHIPEIATAGFGAYVVKQLKDAGFAVIQLPEPTIDHHDTDDGSSSRYEFSDGTDAGTVVADDGIVYYDSWEWTPEQARIVGANWLAAADAAEGTP